MPRAARRKMENGIYHVMCRSISEVKLFKGVKDKTRYMNLIQKYKKMHDFKLYAYCLMGNHVHMMIDANGADISKVMHGINLSYVKYFNRKYDRHGHLFQDRFKSKIVDSESYMKNLAVYIHRNPMDYKQYKEKPEKYKFSSLAVYLGLKKDTFGVVDQGVVLSMFGSNPKLAAENHYRIVKQEEENTREFNFKDEKTEYRSCRTVLLRNIEPEKIIKHIFAGFELGNVKIHLKYDRKAVSAKALAVTALKKFAGKSDKEIAKIIGDITQSRISQLCHQGIDMLMNDKRAEEIFSGLIAI